MVLYFGEITDEYGSNPSVASYGQVNIVPVENRVNDRVVTVAGVSVNAGVGYAPGDITAAGAVSWGEEIADYFGITGSDYTSLVGHKLSFFSSQSIDAKLPFSLSFLNISGTSSIHCFFGNLLFGVGYNFQWNAADTYGHDFYCVMNDDYDGLSLSEMGTKLYATQFTKASADNYLDMPCFPDFAPFYFVFGYSQWLSLNMPSSTIGTTLDFFGWHTQGLDNASNWRIMLVGDSGTTRRSLKLKDEIAGITEIVLAEPRYFTSASTALFTGFGFESDYADYDKAITYDRMIAGTDLSYLRKVSGTNEIELENGAFILNYQNDVTLDDDNGGLYKVTIGQRYNYTWLDDTTAGIGGPRSLYLMVTVDFAELPATQWIDAIDDNIAEYSYATCPVQFVTYGLVGAVSDYSLWSSQYASTLLGYTPVFRYNMSVFGNVTYGSDLYYARLGDDSVITKAYWENILDDIYVYEQEIDIGEGSIGGGYSSPEGRGGRGSFDDSSDPVHAPSASMSGATNLSDSGYGLFNTFKTDASALIGLGKFLSESSIFDDHSEYVNGIVSVKNVITPGTPSVGSSIPLVLCGQTVVYGEEGDRHTAWGSPLSYQFERFSLGTFTIPEYFGSFMDYAPYTSIKLYLPFAGEYDLDPSVVVGCTMTLYCFIDYISGNIVYNLDVVDSETGLDSTIYTFNGNCSYDIPITYQDYNGKISSYANAFLGIATTALAGAAGGPVGGAVAVTAGSQALAKTAEASRDPGRFGTVGMLGKNNGFMAPRTAHLTIKRPRVVTPESYGHDIGWPCEVSGTVGSFSGFTVMGEAHMDGVAGATDNEIAEIKALLESGVIV